MKEKKIVVPEGMLEAAVRHATGGNFICSVEDVKRFEGHLEAALRWLSENPIVPTDQDDADFRCLPRTPMMTEAQQFAVEWQRRMFLAPEPDPDEPIKDLLIPNFRNAHEVVYGVNNTRTEHEYTEAVREAYRRGRESQ